MFPFTLFFYNQTFFVLFFNKWGPFLFFITKVSSHFFFLLTKLLFLCFYNGGIRGSLRTPQLIFGSSFFLTFFPCFFFTYIFFHDRGVWVNLHATQFFSHYCLKRCFPLTFFLYNQAFFVLIFNKWGPFIIFYNRGIQVSFFFSFNRASFFVFF